MRVVRSSYTLRFLCPAFLGNADQSGQWRTPPMKALLRQWWRVAYMADNGFAADVKRMREAEGRLFGAAADAGASNKSRVRIRLDSWDAGSLKNWQPTGNVRHPEVGPNGRNVGSDLYLGYGPLDYDNKNRMTILKRNGAIQAGESAVLNFALIPTSDTPQEETSRIATALVLMNLYGTLGGRSRNGWGSFALEPPEGTPAPPFSLKENMLRSWQEALALDWPHAIGRDQKGALVWQTEPFGDWKAAMRRLAEIKIGLRTKFKFEDRNPNTQARHWLSYPVTHHAVTAWDKDHLRLPNSLRFKLRPDSRDRGKLRGVIFHVPCSPPPKFQPNPNRQIIEGVWKRVHEFLDNPAQKLNRIPA